MVCSILVILALLHYNEECKTDQMCIICIETVLYVQIYGPQLVEQWSQDPILILNSSTLV